MSSSSEVELERPSIWASVLTPSGRAAVAVVRLCGPDALETVRRLLHCSPPLTEPTGQPDRQLRVGSWLRPDGERVIVHLRAPDQVDINCHGGPMAVREVTEALVAAGASLLPWPALARRQLPDAIAAEALEALAQAATLRTAAILLDQYAGALARCVRGLADSVGCGQPAAARKGLQELLTVAPVGLHLTRPWRVAMVGRVNVGKSSLFNALLGFQRAIIAAGPGTTRDLVTATAAFDGWPVELCDSAGLRPAEDELERAGMLRARQAARNSDRQLVVLDRSQPLAPQDRAIIACCRHGLTVANKSDLPAAWDAAATVPAAVTVSALTGAGIDTLAARLAQALVPDAPGPGQPVPFTERQVSLLSRACEQLNQGDMTGAAETLRQLIGPSGQAHAAATTSA